MFADSLEPTRREMKKAATLTPPELPTLDNKEEHRAKIAKLLDRELAFAGHLNGEEPASYALGKAADKVFPRVPSEGPELDALRKDFAVTFRDDPAREANRPGPVISGNRNTSIPIPK